MKNGNRNGRGVTIRDSILATLIAGVLAAVILAVVSAGASAVREGLIVELLGGVSQSNLKSLPLFPAGAVVAFDNPKGCPEGWTPLKEAQGKTIVGVDVSGESDEERYEYRDDGGEHEVTLTDRHLPQHQHAYKDVYYTEQQSDKPRDVAAVGTPGRSGSNGGRDYDNVGWLRPDTVTDFSGLKDPDAFTNMQPYIVLYYCKLE